MQSVMECRQGQGTYIFSSEFGPDVGSKVSYIQFLGCKLVMSLNSAIQCRDHDSLEFTSTSSYAFMACFFLFFTFA
jgi:hypothetical protein